MPSAHCSLVVPSVTWWCYLSTDPHSLLPGGALWCPVSGRNAHCCSPLPSGTLWCIVLELPSGAWCPLLPKHCNLITLVLRSDWNSLWSFRMGYWLTFLALYTSAKFIFYKTSIRPYFLRLWNNHFFFKVHGSLLDWRKQHFKIIISLRIWGLPVLCSHSPHAYYRPCQALIFQNWG